MVYPHVLAPLIGFVAGVIGSMLGLGGGFLMVPLMNIAGVDVKIAIGTSAAAVFFNAVSATVAYARHRYVVYKAGLLISATAVAAAYLGAQLTACVDANALRVIFGFVLLAVSYRVAATGGRRSDPGRGSAQLSTKGYATLLGGGVLAGLVSGLLGVGGGVINVPLLTYLGFAMHSAVATSSMAITLTSVTSAISHYTLGNVDLVLLALLAPALIVGAQIGASVARRTNPRSLRRAFSVALAFIALRMILKGLGFQVP